MRVMTRLFRSIGAAGLLILSLAGVVTPALAADPAPLITRGGALKKRAYQTYAAMTFYVDPTGSDANACTASGTAACLTFGAALNKVPKNIRHAVTVNVATGTYTEVFRVQGFFIEGANGAASTAALNIVGTQENVTPTSGSATGTLASYTAGTGGLHGTATVTAAGWTVDNFRGRFLRITGGTGSGQFMPILSNTATVLSLAANFSVAPNATSTFAIVSPGPVFTGTTPRLLSNYGSGTVAGTLQISDIEFTTAFTTNDVSVASLIFSRSRFIGGVLSTRGPSQVSFSTDYFETTNVGVSLGNNTRTSISSSLIYCTTACSNGITTQVTPVASVLTNFHGTIYGSFSTALVNITSQLAMSSVGNWFDCTSNTHTAIRLSTATNSAATYVGSGWAQNTGPFINGCGTGYSLNSPSLSYIDNGTVFTNVTNAITLTAGARAVIEAGTTFTALTDGGVMNQLSIDGTVYTDADLTTFTRITGPQGSYATRP